MTMYYTVEFIYKDKNNTTLYAHFNSKKVAEEYAEELRSGIKTLKSVKVRQCFDGNICQ